MLEQRKGDDYSGYGKVSRGRCISTQTYKKQCQDNCNLCGIYSEGLKYEYAILGSGGKESVFPVFMTTLAGKLEFLKGTVD